MLLFAFEFFTAIFALMFVNCFCFAHVLTFPFRLVLTLNSFNQSSTSSKLASNAFASTRNVFSGGSTLPLSMRESCDLLISVSLLNALLFTSGNTPLRSPRSSSYWYLYVFMVTALTTTFCDQNATNKLESKIVSGIFFPLLAKLFYSTLDRMDFHD